MRTWAEEVSDFTRDTSEFGTELSRERLGVGVGEGCDV